MAVISLRSGSPGVRLGLAFAASLALHLAVLLPADGPRRKAPSPALSVELPAPESASMLATRPEPAPAPAAPPLEPPAAAPPAPAPSLRQPSPKPLSGRALDTALAALTREEFYPREAIARGLEGRVVLLLTLDAADTVTGVEVASGSGHALLDNAALKAAGRIGALPGGRRQALLPVEFRLE